jgi:F-type H+-transporting ATPase subunit delta
MAEKQTLARPYAEAVFEFAKGQNQLKKWSEMLAFIAAVATDGRMIQIADDPRVDRVKFLNLFLGVCEQRVDEQGANFVRLLVDNRRLALLPEIVAQYESLRAEAEARVEATVISAFPLEAAQLDSLGAALKRRLGREVNLTAQVDQALLGGVVIRAGDLVIDGSVRGRLADLAANLSH